MNEKSLHEEDYEEYSSSSKYVCTKCNDRTYKIFELNGTKFNNPLFNRWRWLCPKCFQENIMLMKEKVQFS